MERLDIEEKNARCNFCAIELSIIEVLLYGNRCVWCSSETLPLYNMSLWEYWNQCFWDWKLYQAIVKLWKAKGKEDSKMLLLGCLAEMGKININEIRIVADKKILYKKIMSYAKRGGENG